MADKLKPCPFCGGEVRLEKDFAQTKDPVYYFECDKCGILVYPDELIDREKSIEAWNTRPNPWHTGDPIEEGDYYIAFRNFLGADVEYGWATWDGKGWDINFMGWLLSNEILAWQKIEPYKEKEDGGK